MLEGLVFAVLITLLIIGTIAVSYIIALRFLTPKRRGMLAVVIPAREGDEELARLMYSAHLRLSLPGGVCMGNVYALDLGMSDSQIALCRSMCRECEGMYICKPQELMKMLTEDKSTADD